jgi:predicted  nucleic acid-binding Zn-ribbon protein
MEARREAMWQQDAELQKMNDQLAYAQRQLNTALGTGQQKEADDLKAEVELLETTIKARQDLIPADPVYADLVDQLQKLIDQQQASMKEDRQRTAKALDDAQQAFAGSQPAVNQLPAQQQSLASDMEKRLADISAARAKYSDAASAVGGGTDDATKKLQDQAASIAASIQLHRRQLADASHDAQRQQQIKDKQQQLAQLTQAATDAENACKAKASDLQQAQASLDAAHAAGDELAKLVDQQIPISKQQAQLLADLPSQQENVKTAIQPLLVTDADIHSHVDPDKRMVYSAASIIPICILFGGLILWTIHAASRELPLNALSPSDDGPEPFSLPSLPSNGSGGNGSSGNESPAGHALIEESNGDSEALESLTGASDASSMIEPTEEQPADAVING